MVEIEPLLMDCYMPACRCCVTKASLTLGFNQYSHTAGTVDIKLVFAFYNRRVETRIYIKLEEIG